MQHFEATIASYNETDFSGYIIDPHIGALSRIGVVLWHLGSADQGRAKIREAISLSERLKSPANMAFALMLQALFTWTFASLPTCMKSPNAYSLSRANNKSPSMWPPAPFYRGWAMAEQGRTDEGVALIRTVLDSSATLGLPANAETLRVSSEAQARAGQLEEALATIEQAFSAVGEMQIHLPGVLWRRGELHLRRGDETQAAADFREAIAVARRIGSKAYELRATTSLARLLAKQGKRDEARAMLAEIYNWFTEGFDTADLKDAKALLEELNE